MPGSRQWGGAALASAVAAGIAGLRHVLSRLTKRATMSRDGGIAAAKETGPAASGDDQPSSFDVFA